MRVLGAMFILSAPVAALADKPVRIIVPFPPGGAMDKIARVVAAELANLPTGKLVVENRPGADGLIAVEQMLQQAEGGTSVLMVNPYFTTAQANGRLTADKAARFKAVAHLGNLEIYLIAGRRSGLKSVSDLFAPRDKPLGCAASAGQFTTICDRLAREYPNTVISVPYRGEAQALNDLLGGHVDVMPITRVSAEPHLAADTVSLVANLSKPLSSTLPADTPYVLRTSIKSFFGLVVSDEMSEAAARQLTRDVDQILQSAGFAAAARTVGLDLLGGSESSFERFLMENVVTQTRLLGGAR